MLALFAFSVAHALEPDLDGDGFTTASDCDDSNAAVNPDADEACDGIDNDCDALVDDDDDGVIGQKGWHMDADGDGLGTYADRTTWACSRPWGYVRNRWDCDDTDATRSDWIYSWVDSDGDGYGSPYYFTIQCESVPAGYAPNNTDCDESNADDCDAEDPATHPDAAELCDGIDNDCDGSIDESVTDVWWYADADGDGYGDAADMVSDCAQPSGYGFSPGDCDDANASVFPSHREVCGNGVDDDCDGGIDDCVRDPAAVADFTMTATEPAAFGAPIRTADANGDGVADLLVGAPWGADGYGEVAVVIGPKSGDATSDEAEAIFTGAFAGSAFGSALDGGDFDGDGYDDLLVGAPATSSNSAWLFYGPLTGDVDADRADVYIEGNAGAYTHTASAVEIVPDHDGDGAADVVIGMPSAIAWQSGHVIILSAPLDRMVNMRKGASLAYGGNSRDYSGTSLADLGDQNGDGFEDILIGAPNDSRVYVENGGTDQRGWMAYDADAVLQGNHDRNNVFGAALAAADLDGDGYGDVVVAAPWEPNVRGDRAGVVTVYFGPLSGTYQERAAVLRYEGTDPAGWFGASVAAGGDVDGDGSVDTLIGDPVDGQYPYYSGAVYLQRGLAEGLVDVRDMTEFQQGDYTSLGSGEAFVPDWNGDGADEIAVGAPGAAADDGSRNGKLSVIFSDSLFE